MGLVCLCRTELYRYCSQPSTARANLRLSSCSTSRMPARLRVNTAKREHEAKGHMQSNACSHDCENCIESRPLELPSRFRVALVLFSGKCIPESRHIFAEATKETYSLNLRQVTAHCCGWCLRAIWASFAVICTTVGISHLSSTWQQGASAGEPEEDPWYSKDCRVEALEGRVLHVCSHTSFFSLHCHCGKLRLC